MGIYVGCEFIKWIRLLYSDPNIVIKNNGYLSREIQLSTGLRQGCPISAILFILCVEIMAIKIRTNSKIKGFIFNDKEKIISQFADDSTLTLINLESICETILTVNEFSKHAGLRLNVNKSEAFLLGPLKHLQLDSYAGVKICHVSLKCIGINIAHDKQMCKLNNLKIYYNVGLKDI